MLTEEALAQAMVHLHNEGVESPRLDAELILAHVLDVNRAAVLARPDRQLTPKQLTSFRELVNRRGARVPLAYILGHREFYGLEFAVDPHVLVPRPETELLVERALWLAPRLAAAPQIADVGSGSGAIAVTLAVHLPQATVYALDQEAGALAVTALNAQRHGVAARLTYLQGDLLQPIITPVDLIVSNPPYVTPAELETVAPEVGKYEPQLALNGGANGLEIIEKLLSQARTKLNPRGSLLVEIGAAQGDSTCRLAQQYFPQAAVNIKKDLARIKTIQSEKSKGME